MKFQSMHLPRRRGTLPLLLAACWLPLLGACGDSDAPAPGPAAGNAEELPAVTGGAAPGSLGAPQTGPSAAEVLARGKAFLLRARDAEKGGWGDPAAKIPTNGGFTGMAVLGVIAGTPRAEVATTPEILAALRYLASFQGENGAIVDDPKIANYTTSVSVGAFAAARVAEFASIQAKARDWLAASQIRGDDSDLSYGGFPYKQATTGQPADLSNLQMAAQGLKDAGLPEDHETWKAMQTYLARVQNASEGNELVLQREVAGEKVEVVSGDDGGAVYGPGESKAGLVKRSDGRYEPRSYGSMSYALLKCLLFAGVPGDDPRVERVVGWIQDHYTFDTNPGFEGGADLEKEGRKGYYYYLYTAARALAEYEKARGEKWIVRTQDGRVHDWRHDLRRTLVSLQRDDGSWVNDRSDMWHEASPVLATSYAMQALAFVEGRLP